MRRALRWLAPAAAFALLVLGGCRGAAKSHEPIDPAFQPAFDALAAAVGAHEDELARSVLARILGRDPDGATRRRAEAFDSILTGRALAGELHLTLIGRPAADGNEVVVSLEARHGLPGRVRFRAPPGRLKHLLTGIDASGFEQRSARILGAGSASELSVPPGETVRVDVGRFELRAGSALAVRGRWELNLMPGEIDYQGRRYPVNEIPVGPLSQVRLASFLPSGEVDPAELVRYLDGDHFSTAAMLERAVRIDSDRRGEALDLLTPLLLRMTTVEVERAVPALRWLSGRRELGGNPAAWRVWMRARSERGRSGSDPELSLPPAVAG